MQFRVHSQRRPGIPSWNLTLVVFLILSGVTLTGGARTPIAAAADDYQVSPEPSVTERTIDSLSDLAKPAEQKVWVFLTDKGIYDEATYVAALEQVARDLDAHAVARRAKVLAPPFVDYLDIPVARSYAEQLEHLGVAIDVESRWFNAVSARASLEVWREVASLPFVQKLTLVRGGSTNNPMPSQEVNLTTGARGALDYGPSFDQLDEINIVPVHDLGFTGAGVRVAMLDTGYYQDHAAFVQPIANGQLIAQWDFINDDGETQDETGDSFGQHLHGTLTWSIVGGFEESELIGAAYGADFLLAKTEDTSMEDPSEEDYWVAGMEWADLNGADVISSSLGYKDWYAYQDLDGQTAVTTIAADIAVSRGIVVCTAMGNEGTTDWYYLIAPADANTTLSVGGSTASGDLWDQSSHGPTFDGRTKPEVLARGSLTRGAASPEDHLGEGYRDFDGTSVATPLVAGAAALLLEAHPGWTPENVREALMMTADNSTSPDNDRGWGRIDVLAALDYVPTAVPGPEGVRSGQRITASPNPFSGRTTIALGSDFTDDPVLLECFSPDGRVAYSHWLESGHGSLPLEFRHEDGQSLAPGIYLVRVRQGKRESTTKIVISP